ncbi:MAG: hypothetical protein N2D54_01420 [Chloroflexota bacterium]
MKTSRRFVLPLVTAFIGSVLLTAVYFGIVSLAESPQHALELFWEERWIVLPMILGFGVQVGLYTILKKRLFIPIESIGPSGPLTGASGATSTFAMIACCAHHVVDVLPILGLSVAATFLAEYQTAFMFVGLGTTFTGILVMLYILIKERQKALGLPMPSIPIKRKIVISLFILISGIAFAFLLNNPLSASADSGQTIGQQPSKGNEISEYPSIIESASKLKDWPDGSSKVDQQGAVEVSISPINLNSPENGISFQIGLNTHSVDLNMNLADLSIIELDNGLTLSQANWEGEIGGHHLSGVLVFPLSDKEISQLNSARQITLTIKNVDALSRSFIWQR